MKVIKLLCLSVLVISALATPNISAKAVTGDEYQAVVATAYNYFNGAAKGDQAMLAEAFDLEFGHVKMISRDNETQEETIRSVPLDVFAGYFKKATKDTWRANVLSVDIVEDKMAMVKLDFHTPKTHYIDYLVMYKRQGKWRIVNKTFIANKKG